MTRRSRRAVLGLAGGIVASLAGCADLGDDAGTATGGPTDTERPTDTPTPTGSDSTTTGRATVRFEPADLPDEEAILTVYPADLREWLREAATTGETVRAAARVSTDRPRPVLPAFDRVRLTDPESDVDGWYDLQATGGVRYDILAGAEAVTPPDNATVTPVSELDDQRRRLVEAAIDGRYGDEARFYPETELGEWARTEFFDGYVSRNGTVYRGMEVQQTDAAFFSREIWYILSLDPLDDGPGPTLDLVPIENDVSRELNGFQEDRDRDGGVTWQNAPESLVAFADRTDYLLTHTSLFRVSIESG